MEVARVLAERSHNPVIYENEDELGGHLIEAGVPNFKADLRTLRDWYITQLKRLKVPIYTKTEVTKKLIDEKKPDVVVVATGSNCIMPTNPGVENSNVCTAVNLLLGKNTVGERIVIVGGSMTGCETALWLAQMKKKVTVIEQLPNLMADAIGHTAKDFILDSLSFYGVEMRTSTSLGEVTDEGVTVIDKDLEVKSIPCDSVVLACGQRSDDHLYKTLRDGRYNVYRVGDCMQPGKIIDAIWTAYNIANSL